jgi:multisubunit Na+/H+ antiporter MnhB subunit
VRIRTALLTLVLTLAIAAPAFAGDNGEGLWGETDGIAVTFVSLGVLIFFVLVIVLLSALQGRLERRKEERKAADGQQPIGW